MPRAKGSGKLSQLQMDWAKHYKRCGSPKLASKLAGYNGNEGSLAKIGQDNLKNPKIQAYLKDLFQAEDIQAPEIRARFSRQARASVEVFLDDNGNIDLLKLKEADAQDLIRKIKNKKTVHFKGADDVTEILEIEVTLHDPQVALDRLARMEGLYKDKVEVSGEIQHEHRVTVEPAVVGSALDLLRELGAIPAAPAPAAVDPAQPLPQTACRDDGPPR